MTSFKNCLEMNKTIDIKVGDIVTIRGQKQRVMQLSQHCINLSCTGIFNLDDFKRYMKVFKDDINVEHVTLPQLNIGDLVVVKPIPIYEQNRSGLMWWSEKNAYIDKVWPVTYIRDTAVDGQIATLGDGQAFQIYHLEKVKDYDMI